MVGLRFAQTVEAVAQDAPVVAQKRTGDDGNLGVAAGIAEDDDASEGSQQTQALAARWLSSCVEDDIDASPCGGVARGLGKTCAQKNLVVAEGAGGGDFFLAADCAQDTTSSQRARQLTRDTAYAAACR